MNRFVVTIGGTGAKCFEALVFLSAAGAFNQDVTLFHIDPDKNNGNWIKAYSALLSFQEIKKQISRRDILGRVFNSSFQPPVEGMWVHNPYPRKTDTENYTSLREYCGNDDELLQLLFAEKARNDDWEIGFKGRASVGSIAAAACIKEGLDPWDTIIKRINSDATEETRFFLLGSIFGGSGASIFPTVAKLLSKRIVNAEKFVIGGSLLFPYFRFEVPTEESLKAIDRTSEDFAKPGDFLPKAKQHLEYYQKSPQGLFRRIYIVGCDQPRFIPPFYGGKEQMNPSHYLEMVAVMAGKDFFTVASPELKKLKYMHLCEGMEVGAGNSAKQREGDEKIKDAVIWKIFPEGEAIGEKLLVFATMAYSFLEFWNPLLDSEEFKRTMWFKELIGDDPQFREKIAALGDFFEKYLNWLLEIHYGNYNTISGGYDFDSNMQLFDAASIKKLLGEVNAGGVAHDAATQLNRLKYNLMKNDGNLSYTPRLNAPYDGLFLWKNKDEYEKIKKVNRGLSQFESLLNIIKTTSESLVKENYRY
ncbi:MAG: hypothetical protein K9K75_06590 [Deltaproteobacteria bacterium]|nr:hypothetical protein [Deltaproteobacteria bacterium]